MDPNIVKQTQETLGKFITKPPLTEKLLNKPPFRFLHDLITEVIRTTNFLQGLYSDEEMDSKKVTTREGKIEFLQKAITCTSIVHGSALPAKPSKIVAGHDPENTNAFLQVMARCIRKSMSSEEAVKMVLTGEIPTKKDPSPKEKESTTGAESAPRPSKKEHRPRDEKSSKHRSREEKEGGGEKDEKATKEEKDKRRRERSEKSREGGSEANKEKSRSREDREKSKHREDREKSKHREDREKSKPREDGEKSKHREDREKSKPREDGEKSKHREDREKSKHREDREKSKHREREKSKHREEKENAPQGDEKGKSSKRSEDKDAEKEKRRQERKKRHEQKEKGEHVERPDGGKDEEKPKQLAKKEKIETPVKLADVDDKKSKDQEEENVTAASVRAQRPASAKGQRRRPQTRNSGRNEITTNETPAAAVEPPAEAEAPAFGTRKLVRPPSARPSAPRVRRNAPSAADENLEASGQDKNATIIVDRDENMTLSDEEDAQFVVQEDTTAEDPDLLPAVLSAHSNGDLNSEEHGGLVRKILETKKELEGSASKQKLGRTEIQQSNVVTAQQQKEQQLVVQEIEQLRTSVQKLCQSSAPLAKLIDYSQEDMDAMQNELQMWKKENKEHGFKIKEDNNATALSIEPLKSELEELEQAIGVYRTQMAATKANIIRNEDKIHKMMIAVATRA